MKKLSIIAIALLCSGLTVLASNHSLELKSDTTKKTKTTKTAVKTTKTAVQYTCPMDKDVITNKPGKCPKCGMTLIKKEATKTTKKAN